MAMSMLASVAYIDIAIGVLLGFGLIVGAIKGFGKSLKSSFLIVLIVALLLCSVTASFLKETSMGLNLTNALTGSLEQAGGNAFTQPLYYDAESKVYYVIVDGANVEFMQAMQGTSLAWSAVIFKLLLPSIMGGQTGISLVAKVAPGLTNIIFMAISFILLCIIIKLVFIILNKLYQKVLDKVYALKVVDKILGSVYGGLKSFVFVVIAMAIVGWVASFDFPQAALIQEQIDISTIGKWLTDNNLLSQVFTAAFAK